MCMHLCVCISAHAMMHACTCTSVYTHECKWLHCSVYFEMKKMSLLAKQRQAELSGFGDKHNVSSMTTSNLVFTQLWTLNPHLHGLHGMPLMHITLVMFGSMSNGAKSLWYPYKSLDIIVKVKGATVSQRACIIYLNYRTGCSQLYLLSKVYQTFGRHNKHLVAMITWFTLQLR